MRVVCAKCNEKMENVVLDKYEYVKRFPLYNVPAYQCKKCSNLFFMEKMVKDMEKRTKELKVNAFGFERAIAVSGKGLVLRMPSDLVSHLKLKEGENVKIIPVDHKGFLVERISQQS